MCEYEFIMFLAKDKIFVMEVDYNGHTKAVGGYGDDYFSYNNNNDLDDFYKTLCDKYNVDNLSDLDTNVFIIDCGMENAEKWYLIDKLKSCKSLSVNNVSSLFPILLSKKGLLNVGEQTVIDFLGEKYAYICDKEYHVEAMNARGKNVQYVFNMDDFSFIAYWKGNLSQNSKELEKSKIEIEKLKDNQKSYEIQISEYQKKYNELEAKYDELKVRMAEETEKQKKAKSQEMINNRRYIEVETPLAGMMTLFIKHNVKNGALVAANQKIGGVFISRGNADNFEYDIYSPRAGKILWLQLDCDELLTPPNIKLSSDKEIVVGIVGDESDDASDMKEGLLERTKEYTKWSDDGHTHMKVNCSMQGFFNALNGFNKF